MVAAKLSQQRFDHMRSLIRKLEDSPVTRGDLAASGDSKLLGALLSIFVEDLILDGSITVRDTRPLVRHETRTTAKLDFLSSHC